jgi:molybdopterin-guanine dinucleotide biosynthesis protein B
MTLYNAHVPLLGFVATSGTGKTTLLIQLIPLLKNHGVRIGLIKHSHHDFEIDQQGKDSYRLRKAGASPVMLVSPYRRAIISELSPQQEPCLDQQLKFFDQSGLDLLLIEGFKHEPIPKIELHRPSLKQALLYPTDPHIIAIATDRPLLTPDYLTQLDLNQAELIADYILTLL